MIYRLRTERNIHMKTLNEFMKEIEGSETLQNELSAIKDKDAAAAFLKKYDVSGSVEDFRNAVIAIAEAQGAISDDAAESAAGGIMIPLYFDVPWLHNSGITEAEDSNPTTSVNKTWYVD